MLMIGSWVFSTLMSLFIRVFHITVQSTGTNVLYMCDVSLLVMKSGLAQLKILAMINDIDWRVKHFHGGCN